MGDERQPLLSASFTPAGDHEPRVPVWRGEYPPAEFDAPVTGSEIRAAASQDPYPPWIRGAVLTPNESNKPPSYAEATEGLESGLQTSVQGLQEEEIRDLLIDHVGHQCCWGKQPAWAWRIHKVEDCNAYVGTLETFIEERDVVEESEPYDGRQIDGKVAGHRVPGPWELDTRAEFPPLFVAMKEARLKLPQSEVVQQCSDCFGQGEVACPVCTVHDEAGNVQQRKNFTCSSCHGRGLIAHMDGSDSSCKGCKGTGKVDCSRCQSRGLLECNKCNSKGAFLLHKDVLVKWRSLLSRKVIASCHAASVPDEVFQRAKGVQIYSNQSHQCQPVHFHDSAMLNKFSQEIMADRPPVPHMARIISERHQITLVPVTRVVMTEGKKWFKFYIIGLKKEIFMKDYPCKCCSCCSQSGCAIL